MARGETKFGYADLQNSGATTGSRKRGGEIIPRRMTKAVTVAGAAAATAGNYGVFFTAPTITRAMEPDETSNGAVEWEVTSVVERHATAGSDGSAVTLMLKKVPSGTAASAGTDMLASGINLKATADTNNPGTLHATLANIQLKGGESLALVTTGTLTALAHVSVTVELRRV